MPRAKPPISPAPTWRAHWIAPGCAELVCALEGAAAPPRAAFVEELAPLDLAWEHERGAARCAESSGTLVLAQEPERASVLDAQGELVLATHRRRASFDGEVLRVAFELPPGMRLHGGGERTGELDLRGRHLLCWNRDAFGFGVESDPLYQGLPWLVLRPGPRDARHGRAAVLFVDDPGRVALDLGRSDETALEIATRAKSVRFVLCLGDSLAEALERATALTGRSPLPPRWALGFQQCRYSYVPEAKVREVAATLRARRLPCDVLYLDIDHMQDARDFTWNARDFPRPEKLLRDLRAQGFRVVTIQDPGIAVDTSDPVQRSGAAQDAFLRTSSGTRAVARVWPGPCTFPDFLKSEVRAWWGQHYAAEVQRGVAGFWNDMNEPAVIFSPEATLRPEVRGGDARAAHERWHNLYGREMARATCEGVRAAAPKDRAFVLSRAGWIGSQRWAWTWTGDNTSSWDHLRLSLRMVQSLGLSGQPFSGPDIGGFIGEPDGELFARWLGACALLPFCRVHTMIGTEDQEPWSYGAAVERACRSLLELRYRLLPYLYTAVEQACRTGVPMIRPAWCDDARANDGDPHAFLIGESLYAAPVVEARARKRRLLLPPGDWVRFEGTEIVRGEIEVACELGELPLFARAGSVIPVQEPVAHTGLEKDVVLAFRVHPLTLGARVRSSYYDDAGTSAESATMPFLRCVFETRGTERGVEVAVVEREGRFRPRRPGFEWVSPTGEKQKATLRAGARVRFG
jgi:alpha-glucosidase